MSPNANILPVLLPIASVILLTSIIGNVRIFRNSYERYKKSKSVTDTFFLCLCSSNLASCCVAIPLHIAKLIVDYNVNISISTYLCLFRYLTTMVTINVSLISLTALIISRKDKIIKQPFGLSSTFTKNNIKRWITFAFAVSIIPNIIIFCILLYMYIHDNMLPCQKVEQRSNRQKILNIADSITTALVAVPAIVIMLRSIAQLRRSIRMRRDSSDRMKKCLRKINATFLYAAIFMIFWIPFGCMCITAGEIEDDLYNSWFNIGYTISYGYLVGIPIVCEITDNTFKSNHHSRVKQKHSLQSMFEVTSINNIGQPKSSSEI